MGSLQWGALLLIDYGYEQYELDHPDRCGGTVAGHWRHRRIDDWEELLARPGAQDLTAHVNFSEIAEAIAAPGVDLCLQTQAAWLLDQGVLEDARQRLFGAAGAGSPPQGLSALTALSGLQTLLSDGAMGQSFLVLTATRGLAA
jgi:SAM-dependent MidA family methyltransferase